MYEELREKKKNVSIVRGICDMNIYFSLFIDVSEFCSEFINGVIIRGKTRFRIILRF